ncbi:HK97-gp10 family putative phage morphogenesis protein [Auraticoccus monumenti]|uniref:Phage protein, HK97 gp10 family n=1 Tax=Auraticoccus monumenti TaxID=675864 RepID=A0A1G6UJX0_9ACTN|nr:HK97-gp10 family putative phage morphogenesis protein [Auraticoccus monumenti]SDD41026.1 phage protein, HK97 gp10 family [Auraticoccus monumenti]
MTVSDWSEINTLAVKLDQGRARVGRDVSQEVRRNAAKVEELQRQLVAWETGFTHDSITTVITGTGNSQELYADVGPTHFVGRFLEWGTEDMAPQPFAAPALRAHESGFVKGVERVAGGLL